MRDIPDCQRHHRQVLVSLDPGKVATGRITLEEVLGNSKSSLQKLMHLLKDLSPDETVVKFGLRMRGETGVIIANRTAEVNLTFYMSWKSE